MQAVIRHEKTCSFFGLTANQKLRRGEIERAYAREIAELYA